jgi:hypothetical protein
MANSIETFLERFVVESDHDEARESMADLFSELHASLAREFMKSYGDDKKPATTKAKEAKPVVPKCQAKTSKGDECQRKCCADSDEFCAMHLKQSQKPKAEPKAKKVSKKDDAAVVVPKCQAKTAKGDECPRKCCADSDEFCVTHLKQSQKPKAEPKAKAKAEPKAKASKKVKVAKRVAEHNHDLGEKIDESVSDNCELCQTHGNTLDPELVDEDFEGISDDMQSRLQEILSNISELDDAEEDDDAVAGPSKLVEDDGEYEEDVILDMPDLDAGFQSGDEDEDDVEEDEDC